MRHSLVTFIVALFIVLPSAAQAQSPAQKILAQRFAGQLEMAEAGDLDAQLNVAASYRHGLGVEENQAEALRWYEIAADQGSGLAMYELGSIIHQSHEPDDPSPEAKEANALALVWFEHAAKAGFAPAQSTLGLMYGFGDRVEIDKVRGRMWLLVAKANGQETQTTLVKMLDDRLSADEMEAAASRAETCIASGFTDCN